MGVFPIIYDAENPGNDVKNIYYKKMLMGSERTQAFGAIKLAGTTTFTTGAGPAPFEVLATAEGYQGAKVSWNAADGATGYEVYVGETKVAEAGADATEVVVTELTDAQKYTFTVKALGADLTADTQETEIYTLCNWTEPQFELKPVDDKYQFIAHNLTNVNYAYGGAITNDNDSSKSTIKILKDGELVYTLTNGTGQGTLTAWAGYGRWALNAQDDRKDWVWADADGNVVSIKADGNPGEVNAVPATFFAPGEYTIEYTIGYVVNKNGRWATAASDSAVVANREDGATMVFFGPKDVKPSPNVLYTDDSKSAVRIFAKEGTAAGFTIEAPAPTFDLAGNYTKSYFEIDVDAKSGNSWTDGTYGENIPAFTTVTASTEDGPKWITNYNKYGLTLYFDVDSTELADQPGCYALTNFMDRGPSNQWQDKIVDHGSHYNSTTGEIVFKFVIESSSAPGGYNGGTLEDNGVTVPGWAVGVTMTPAQ